ncbi:hypothetical protein RN001_010364 [Aquatica leii]|uniref:acid phosphatase n=1 Tax=Aquatica leii TaxID=1421715 RepID=A0AAN7SNA1_9COLE|nr:hypothetical protein RN001_010364 [Aquatica leii]
MCTNLCSLVIFIQCILLMQTSSQDVPSYDSNVHLVAVSVIYRHGDRSPFQPYPKDPYRDPKYWPMGYAQLTNIGKMQQYHLGQYLRNRYDNFLSKEYNHTEIYVRSTDTDRTLMSAESNLAGLYPPTADQTWNIHLSWQPIPIHTEPGEEDYLLAMKKPCEKYQQLYETLMNDDEFVEIRRKNSNLYKNLSKNSGQKIDNLVMLQNLYNVLYIEDLYNFTLPEWTKAVYPEPLKQWSDFSFKTATYTTDLARLKTGPLLNEIAAHFTNATMQHSKRFHMYSAHDTTIADILNTLGLFELHCPPYTATIFFELWVQNNSYYVNIFYKNSSEPQHMKLKGCEFNCPWDQFLEIIRPVRMNYDEWEFACQPKFLGVMPFNTLQSGIFTGCMGLLFILLCSFIISLMCTRRRRRSNVDYLRLPSDELS